MADTAPFEMSIDWVENPFASNEPHIDHSLGRLTIRAYDHLLSAYKSDKGDVGSKIEIATYFLAEWIANNWWALLYEPKKTDTDDDDTYQFRHWLGTARNGFALPNVWFNPVGDEIEVDSYETYLRAARLTFTTRSKSLVPRAAFSQAVTTFVDTVLGRLSAAGLKDTSAHEAWRLVQGTAADEELYCRLIGSMGLNPYDDNPDVDNLLTSLANVLPPDMLFDLCQASDVNTFKHIAKISSEMYAGLDNAQLFDASPLDRLELPGDSEGPAYKWGLAATKKIRQMLGTSSGDPSGADELFERLEINPGESISASECSSDFLSIMAAIRKEDRSQIRLGLAGDRLPQRKFAAARAVFLAWYSKTSGVTRLITNAKTRDQQASRAFAAEMLAPAAFIRSRAGRGPISSYRLDEIARELDVSPAVVRYQATNDRKIHLVD